MQQQSPYETITKLAAIFSPLSVPVLLHLFDHYIERNCSKYNDRELIIEFYRSFVLARNAVFSVMNPFVLTGGFSTERFSEILANHSPKGTSISSTTRTDLERRNLLRKVEWGSLEYDSAATLIIARILFSQSSVKNWLPKYISESEPRWWAWKKESPQSPWRVCAFPLQEAANTAIIATSWPGSAWPAFNKKRKVLPQLQWLHLDLNLGAVRFAGIDQRGWKVTLDDLQQWDTEAVLKLKRLARYNELSYRTQDLANAILRDTAYDLLYPGISPAPLAFSHYLNRGDIP